MSYEERVGRDRPGAPRVSRQEFAEHILMKLLMAEAFDPDWRYDGRITGSVLLPDAELLYLLQLEDKAKRTEEIEKERRGEG